MVTGSGPQQECTQPPALSWVQELPAVEKGPMTSTVHVLHWESGQRHRETLPDSTGGEPSAWTGSEGSEEG